jgi:dihydroxyacetone kinase
MKKLINDPLKVTIESIEGFVKACPHLVKQIGPYVVAKRDSPVEAGKAAESKREIDLANLATMIEQSVQEIQSRGGAGVGDKTLLDALVPAVESLRKSASARSPMSETLQKGAEEARIGCESTKNLVAKHGRARYLGEQTLGHADPGSRVISIMFETLLASYNSRT